MAEIAQNLADLVDGLTFASPVHTVYNPLRYAWRSHRAYLERWGRAPKEVILVGMNPGPWGMAQTGVPFGEVSLVRTWLEIEEPVDQPLRTHPKRPIQGFSCPRSEVSGARLWGWARDRFERPEHFFRRFFVYNYCPLAFMEVSGRNRTPDKLPQPERKALFAFCDQALRETVVTLNPSFVIGVGGFARAMAETALAGLAVTIGQIPHPSPASPLANRGWSEAAERELEKYGLLVQQKKSIGPTS